MVWHSFKFAVAKCLMRIIVLAMKIVLKLHKER